MQEQRKLRAVLLKRLKSGKLDQQDTIFIDTLDNLYKLLECSKIDIQVRYINGNAYDFIFDDEYLLNGKSQDANNAIAIGTYKGEIKEIIFGNLIICGIADENGNETSINDNDALNILLSHRLIERTDNSEKLKVLNYNFTDDPKEI